jgi:hypothetical protein
VGNREGKRQLRKSWRRWEGNIKMYFKEILRENVDWIELAYGTDKYYVVVDRAMNI